MTRHVGLRSSTGQRRPTTTAGRSTTRAASASCSRKVGWQDERTDLDVTLTLADNPLDGTQTLPPRFCDPRQPYTYPDTNENRLAFSTLKGSRSLSDTLLLDG